MLKFRIILLSIFLAFPVSSQAKINIFACEPEWKSLAQEIGKDKVEAFSAISATQDPHYIRAKPRLVSKIIKADLLLCSGADLEVGWLPLLIERGKKEIQIGNIGHLMASDFVQTIEKPSHIDRSLGDIHADGNPHIHLNPYNILLIAKELTSRLKLIDPKNSEFYQENYQVFIKKWKSAIKKWEYKIKNLGEINIVNNHKNFSYLYDWLKIKNDITIEVRPGIAPTANHLKSILGDLKQKPADFIVLSPYDSDKSAKWLSKKADIKILILPYTVGGNDHSVDLFSLFDSTVSLIINNM